MRLTISINAPEDVGEQDLLSLDLPESMTVADLKGLIETETRFPNTSQLLYHNGQLLADQTKALESLGIVDGEMLAVHVRRAAGSRRGAPNGEAATAPDAGRGQRAGGRRGDDDGSAAVNGRPDPELLRLRILGDPAARQQLRQQNPDLAAALDQPDRFRQLVFDFQRQQAEADQQRQREIAMLNEDPFNIEAQAKIEEHIRQAAVMENLQNTLEHHPEAFGRVHMLYIDVEVNNHKVKAFVDSGAQTTIMSPSCAEQCGIMRLVDKRFAGIARGVGTAKIIGRVHSAAIKIGRSFLPCSFTVMEGKDVDLLLGLDMLKRHQACIDLRRDRLLIQGEEVAFLGEANIPRQYEEVDEPMVDGPGGAKIGGRTGAVLQPTTSTPAATFNGGSSSSAGATTASAPSSSSSSSHPPLSQRPHVVPSPAAPAGAEANHSRQSVEQLQQLGFSQAEAIAALDATGGNVDYAAGLLFQER